MKRVIVTGATSMMGVATIKACLEHAAEAVYAVIRPDSPRFDRLPKDPRVIPVACEIHGLSKLPELIDDVGFDAFYHFAWSLTGAKRNFDPQEQIRNIGYTLEALEAASRLNCRQFIGAGSQAEYGPLDIPCIAPDTPVHPVQPYGIAKYAAGCFVRQKAEALGMDCSWVRIFSVYGKHDMPTTLVSYAIRSLLKGERPSFTPAEQLWDYLYEDDAGRAFCLIGDRSTGIHIYCLGSGMSRPLKEYIETIRDEIDPSLSLGIGDLPYPDHAVMHLCADIDELTAVTGFRPTITFREGVRQIIGSQ